MQESHEPIFDEADFDVEDLAPARTEAARISVRLYDYAYEKFDDESQEAETILHLLQNYVGLNLRELNEDEIKSVISESKHLTEEEVNQQRLD